MSFRVAVIGPHRRRTGTGPFVSQYLRENGCDVLEWGRTEASRWLLQSAVRPEVDAVAICSPPETHFDYLEAALGKGLHVFCEKPMVWPPDHSGAALEQLIARLAQAFERARRDGLIVHENTQWVYTLEGFRQIAGDFAPEDVNQFRCELSPTTGIPSEMIMETSAHANSLLLGIGCGGVEDLRIDFEPGNEGRVAVLEMEFTSRRPSGGPVQVQYHFAQQTDQPRHAAYEINHRRVDRRVDLSGYRIYLRSGSAEQLIHDPVQASVEDFLSKVAGAPVKDDAFSRLLANIRMSHQFLSACMILPEPPHA